MKYCFIEVILLIPVIVSVSSSSITPQELPNEHDQFEDIRINNKVYVDKSAYIVKLLKQNNRLLRLCRPSNFGKSNFLQMLRSFFEGNKKLFEGLFIYEHHDWQPFPVLYLDFSLMNVRTLDEFKIDLSRTIVESGKSYGIDIPEAISVKSQLWQFLYELSEKRGRFYSMVVLINEYDWPVRRHVENEDADVAREMKHFLDDFFVLFRVRNDEIKLLFLTCTTKLHLNDVDGGSNTLRDITQDPEFAGMIGLTQDELTNNFKSHIDAMVAHKPNETFNSLVRTLREQYSGYCFTRNTSSSCRLYNFGSVISCLRNKNVDNYWRTTGEYNLINVYRAQEKLEKCGFRVKLFEKVAIPKKDLTKTYNFDEPLPTKVCLVLHGYLTFHSYDRLVKWFYVGFPNEEMRDTFKKEMFKCLPGGKLSSDDIFETCTQIENAMTDGNCQDFVERINGIAFRSADVVNLTYPTAAMNYESELIDRVVRVFEACDMDAYHKYEFHDNGGALVAGVIELAVELPNKAMYAIEFEMKKTAAQPMSKLLGLVDREAFQPAFSDREVYLMAIRLSKQGGTIDEWIRVTYFNGNCTDLRASNPSYVKMFAKITKNSCKIGVKAG